MGAYAFNSPSRCNFVQLRRDMHWAALMLAPIRNNAASLAFQPSHGII